MSSAGVLQFVAALSHAQTVEDLTRRLYAGIGAVFDPIIVGFDLLDPNTHRILTTSGHGVSPYFLAKYDQVARDADPVLRTAIATRATAYNLAMMSEAEWREHPLYQSVYSLHRMIGLVCAPVVVDDRVVAILNLGRTEGVSTFSTQELTDAGNLADLLAATVGALQRQKSVEHELALYREALDLVGEPMVISDTSTASRHFNAAARHILGRQPQGARAFDEALIEHSCRSAVDGGLIERTHAIDDAAEVSFLRVDPCVRPLPEWLRRNVTKREAELIPLVSSGLRDAEIAELLQLSVHTVKGYLRDIFKKTGARSRIELARMAMDDRTRGTEGYQAPRTRGPQSSPF